MSKIIMKAGISSVDISPQKGIELCGYAARDGGNKGVHDPVFARTIAIENGSDRAAVMSCDLIGLDFEIIDFVKNEAEKRIGLKPGNLMIACTHSHSGPVTLHNNGIGQKNSAYIEYLKTKLSESLEKAFTEMKPAEIFYSSGSCDIGINRRGKIEEGSIEPSEDPNGFIDNQVSVLGIYEPGNNEPFAVLFNYGCHPTVLSPENYLVSSDYPGAARKIIENSFPGKVTSVFTNGGAGNINPKVRGSFNEVEANGAKLGDIVVSMLKKKGRMLDTLISCEIMKVSLPYAKEFMKDEFTNTLDKYNVLLKHALPGSVEERLCSANINWAKNYLKKETEEKISDSIDVYVQGIKIGGVVLIGIPAEVFAETSAYIKENSDTDVIVLGYTNGNTGYLPTKEEILKGGYEVLEAHKYYDRPSHFSGAADDNVRMQSLQLVSKLVNDFQNLDERKE